MSQRDIVKDSVNQSVVIRIVDSTTGLPEEAVEHDTAGIAMWYRREGATKQTVATAALANLASDHADGGIEHIDDGYYRFDLPDAAFATAVDGVMIGGTVTGMIVIGTYVPLTEGLPALATALATAQTDLDTLTDATALPGQEAPTATPTMVEAMMYLYKAWSNKSTQTNSLYQLFNRGGATVDQKADVEDASGTFTASEVESGP